jgi:hypothetical protein
MLLNQMAATLQALATLARMQAHFYDISAGVIVMCDPFRLRDDTLGNTHAGDHHAGIDPGDPIRGILGPSDPRGGARVARQPGIVPEGK